jgi:hypothetical protein
MHGLRKWSAVSLVVAVAACSDSTNPSGDTLTTAEKSALTNALAGTQFGGLAALVIQEVGQVGSLSAGTAASAQINHAIGKAISLGVAASAATTYEGAVGIAVQFSETIQSQTTTGWFYGVVGWNGINASAGTVDEVVLVGGFGEGGTLPGSASGTVESGDVFALYEHSGTIYEGTTGTASASGTFTGSGTDCSASGQGYTYTCNLVVGTLGADAEFDAIDSNDNTYTQTPVHGASLPAVKMNLDITYTGGAPAPRLLRAR